jgi:hydroxyethylthiazole kinase
MTAKPDPTLARAAGRALVVLRAARPLVHHLTNSVVTNDTANLTLLAGASPVMAHALEEVEDMVTLASALVLNIGTLDPAQVEAMRRAGRRARERGVPIVLDPVGAGATAYRTRVAHELIAEVRPTVVRGNAGEIGTLAGTGGEVRGVDSVGASADPRTAVEHAARRFAAVAAITGRLDYLSDGHRTLVVDHGHPWLTQLTGTGCMATSMIGAFLAVEPDAVLATAAALACFGLAAESAALVSTGPGTFKAALFDAVAALDPQRVEREARIARAGAAP